MSDSWAEADLYEPYVGRWSRSVAREFLAWLDVPEQSEWLEVGCGTGALTETVLIHCAPRSLCAVDQSAGYVRSARSRARSTVVDFVLADACATPFAGGRFDVAVSGLVLNFVADPAQMIAEMARVLRPQGRMALYVWDYAERMELMRYFWDAACDLDPMAAELDEGRRFPVCKPDALRSLFETCHLLDVETRGIEVPTVFRTFDDYWSPFLGGQGPAPGYAVSLPEDRRERLRDLLRRRLPSSPDGSIRLTARAWAVHGRKSGG